MLMLNRLLASLFAMASLSTPALAAATDEPSPAGQVPDPAVAYTADPALRKVLIRELYVEGNTVLNSDVVSEILGRYLGRDAGYEELQQLRNELTQAYIARGYVNSGVLLPDQEVTNGVVTLKAIEGTLNAVELQGNDHLRSAYLEKRLRAELNGVFNVQDLERGLRLMQQQPLIEQVNAELLPGSERGTSVLDLRVRERDAFILAAGYDNHRAPSVGEDHFTVSASHQSLTGNADVFNATYGYADGADDWSVAYSLPLTARDLTVGAYYSKGNSDIVEAPFNELDIVTETQTWGLSIQRPIVRTLSQTLIGGLGFEYKESQSTLGNAPFSFSPGEQAGQANAAIFQVFADWTLRREVDALAGRATIRQGVDLLDATINSGDLPDSEFTTLLVQTQYARRLPFWGAQFLARFTGQLTSDPLLPVERLAVGGATTVRGYRENLLVRDEGMIAGLELRLPVLVNDLGESRIGLTFVPFFDYGWVKDKSINIPGLDDPQSEDISSVGGGLVWNWWKWLYMEAYYGYALTDVPSTSASNSLQEDGIHLLTALRWSF